MRSRTRRTDRGLVDGVTPLDLEEAAEYGLICRRCGDVMGVASVSWTQTSSGSWNGSVSSLPTDTTLSAVSGHEEEEEEGGACWDWRENNSTGNLYMYSGTSDKGPSEIRTTSLQRTLVYIL